MRYPYLQKHPIAFCGRGWMHYNNKNYQKQSFCRVFKLLNALSNKIKLFKALTVPVR
jgi:hypothetical protein